VEGWWQKRLLFHWFYVFNMRIGRKQHRARIRRLASSGQQLRNAEREHYQCHNGNRYPKPAVVRLPEFISAVLLVASFENDVQDISLQNRIFVHGNMNLMKGLNASEDNNQVGRLK